MKTNLNFWPKWRSIYMNRKSRQKIKYLENEKAFKMK